MRVLVLLLVLLAAATSLGPASARAQPFGLAEADPRGVRGHWFDGEDLLVLGGYQHTTLRARSGETRTLPNAGGAVGGVGQGAEVALLVIEHGRLGRLRAGTWQVRAQDAITQKPDGIALREDGSALAWSSFGRELWAISPDDRITRLPVRSKPLLAAVDEDGDFVVFFRSEGGQDAPVVMRWRPDATASDEPSDASASPELPGTLAPHPANESLRETTCFFQRNQGVRLSAARFAFVSPRNVCLVDLAQGTHRMRYPRTLLGGEGRRLRAVAADGPEALIVVEDHRRRVFRYPLSAAATARPEPEPEPGELADPDAAPAAPEVTGEAIGELPVDPTALWFDPRSGYALAFDREEVRLVRLGSREDPSDLLGHGHGHGHGHGGSDLASLGPSPAGDASWMHEVSVDDEVHGESRRAGGRGFRYMLPLGRLGFGGAADVGGNGPGAFAFDLSVGGRLVFRSGDWHPMLGLEAVYSRRGGGLDTHHLGLAAAISLVSVRFGVGVAETLLLGVGDNGQNGVRTSLRVGTLYNSVYLDVAHGYEPGPGRHELRIQLVLDVGILAGVATLVRAFR